ncbi:hypothetical protein T484DRAFT_1808499, partial [Baffinella frigidus]
VSALVQFQTVSDGENLPSHLSASSQKEMLGAHTFLRKTYAALFGAAKVEVVNDFSLLMTLQGSDASLDPALVICHLDVVPIEAGTEGDWGAKAGCPDCSPFSGKIFEGQVWGRGALDMKTFCVGFLHAADALVRREHGSSPRPISYSKRLQSWFPPVVSCTGDNASPSIHP